MLYFNSTNGFILIDDETLIIILLNTDNAF